MNIINLKDQISTRDNMDLNRNNLIKKVKHPSPFVRTRVIIKDDLGNVFEEENQTVLGGSLFVLEKCWKVNSPLTVETLNNIKSVATSGPAVNKEDVKVCLFGVGTGGSGDAIGTVADVKFYEREIVDMIPLRVVDPILLTSEEATKYWFKQTLENGKVAYYLKTFETEPEIKVLWKDAEGDEDGSEVTGDVYNTSRTEPIETFVEMTLKITKKDIREWFELNGEIEMARFNSIALFTGALGTLDDGSQDYKDVKMISKLNIGNEMLTYAKELTIIYRIYTS